MSFRASPAPSPSWRGWGGRLSGFSGLGEHLLRFPGPWFGRRVPSPAVWMASYAGPLPFVTAPLVPGSGLPPGFPAPHTRLTAGGVAGQEAPPCLPSRGEAGLLLTVWLWQFPRLGTDRRAQFRHWLSSFPKAYAFGVDLAVRLPAVLARGSQTRPRAAACGLQSCREGRRGCGRRRGDSRSSLGCDGWSGHSVDPRQANKQKNANQTSRWKQWLY